MIQQQERPAAEHTARHSSPSGKSPGMPEWPPCLILSLIKVIGPRQSEMSAVMLVYSSCPVPVLSWPWVRNWIGPGLCAVFWSVPNHIPNQTHLRGRMSEWDCRVNALWRLVLLSLEEIAVKRGCTKVYFSHSDQNPQSRASELPSWHFTLYLFLTNSQNKS